MKFCKGGVLQFFIFKNEILQGRGVAIFQFQNWNSAREGCCNFSFSKLKFCKGGVLLLKFLAVSPHKLANVCWHNLKQHSWRFLGRRRKTFIKFIRLKECKDNKNFNLSGQRKNHSLTKFESLKISINKQMIYRKEEEFKNTFQ